MRVSGRQVGSWCLWYGLKDASTAYGKRLSGLSNRRFGLAFYFCCGLLAELTELVRISEVGFGALANAEVLVTVPRTGFHCPRGGGAALVGTSAEGVCGPGQCRGIKV